MPILEPPLVVEQGNSPVIELSPLRDSLTGLFVNDAVVQLTIKDGADQEVAGTVWPMNLPYVPGSDGIYRVILEDDVQMIAGQSYIGYFEITVDGITREKRRTIYVVQPSGASVPATSPGSPAFALPDLQTMLNEAMLAYHRLALGGSVTVVVDQNGERVEYSAANRFLLSNYIRSLQMQLGLVTGRPLKVWF